MWRSLDYADIARFCNAHGEHATTIEACRVGLSLDPGDPMLFVYRACAYDELGRVPEAIADCEAALALPARGRSAVLALVTLALLRERAGDPDGAIAAAQAAIAREPADREAHAVLGTLLAWHGDFAAAWPELECHWLDERIRYRQRFPDLSEWDGEPLAGLRLLLVHGQGLGDLIQMIRYVPRLRERGAEVVLEAPPQLAELVRGASGIAEVFAPEAAPRERFDAFARVMSLARLCGEDGTLGTARVPYLHAAPERLAYWAERLPERSAARRIGLAWAGNPFHPNDRRRSIPLSALAPLGATPGVRWISLQYGPRANDPAPPGLELVRFGDAIRDMSDTAAIVAQLDLVISVDTGVAHLAGALGVPVWLLLPWRTEWRWPAAARETPWYPSMRLFHASEPSWSALAEEVARELRVR
jgi:tetratricopeptide (TPR) repeat protein